MLQVTHVGDVAHIAHLVAQMKEITEEEVEGDGRTGMTQVGITIYRRTADIHAYTALHQRTEEFLLSAQCIVDKQGLFHSFFDF